MTSITPVDQIADDHFDRATPIFPRRHRRRWSTLADGDTYQLTSAPVRKRIGEDEVRSLAYNGSIPGPTLRVRKGSSWPSTPEPGRPEAPSTGMACAWTTAMTVRSGRSARAGGRQFTYRLEFPDPGVYWYHPHIREDYGQEMGLYGNIVVVPSIPTTGRRCTARSP